MSERLSQANAGMVSVVIPTYNRANYIGQAIDSVISQSYSQTEIIVIDDGSTDDTPRVVASYGERVRYVWQENSGIGAARNHGVRLSSGEFLGFLDSDDLWQAEKLERQLAAFLTDSKLKLVFSGVKNFISPDLSNEEKQKIVCDDAVHAGVYPAALLLRRETFYQVGEFETHWKTSEFIEWYSRALELGLPKFVIPEALVLRRLHQSNHGRTESNDYAVALKAILDRRRRANQS